MGGDIIVKNSRSKIPDSCGQLEKNQNSYREILKVDAAKLFSPQELDRKDYGLDYLGFTLRYSSTPQSYDKTRLFSLSSVTGLRECKTLIKINSF